VSRRTGLSHSTVHRIWKSNNLYPYHKQKVQKLKPRDFPLRTAFCHFYRQRCQQDPEFASRVLFSDEATFSQDGILNTRNNHTWSVENPNDTYEHSHQDRFSVNIWMGIIGDHLIGPYMMPDRLNAHAYLVFLSEVLPELLEEVPLEVRQNMWYHHDGAPAHYGIGVQNFLHLNYPERWIGRGRRAPVRWPPRSPDFNPLDYFAWGYVKDRVYQTEVESPEDLVARILAVAQEIKNSPDMLRRVRESMLRRCNACIERDGRSFEQIL